MVGSSGEQGLKTYKLTGILGSWTEPKWHILIGWHLCAKCIQIFTFCVECCARNRKHLMVKRNMSNKMVDETSAQLYSCNIEKRTSHLTLSTSNWTCFAFCENCSGLMDREIWIWALLGSFKLCSWARHFTLIVPLSTQEYTNGYRQTVRETWRNAGG